MVLYAFFLFWRYKAISANNKDLPINDEIRFPEVRVIGPGNEPLGVMKLEDAKAFAQSNSVDLVLIAPTANPPVCRAIDYGKFCFERDKKEKENRKKQQKMDIKEVQLSCRIDTNDFNTKANHARRFLNDGDKVRVAIRFKGRQMAHQEIGMELLDRFAQTLADAGTVEKKPVLEGRTLTMFIVPLKK